MSMVICDKCNALVDSDFDTDCFIEHLGTKFPDTIACERCREDMDEENERYEAAQSKHEWEAGV